MSGWEFDRRPRVSLRRMDSPWSSMRWTCSSRRSRIPSATVASPRAACHMATGSWLVTVVGVNPVRFGEGHDLGPFQATGPVEVDGFDGGREPQPGRFQHALEAAVGPFGELAVDEHGEAFLEPARCVVGVLALFEETADH